MNPKSKRHRRSVRVEALDRISALPEGILCHILSFLPTKDSVRTSILSSRWKNIWAAVPSLDFDKGDFIPGRFFSFVDHVLFFRHSSDIKKFTLRLRDYSQYPADHSRINGWIDTAVRRNVVELDLRVWNPYVMHYYRKLPESLFMCKTLVTLKLSSECFADIPTSRCLPSLKFLHLKFWYPLNDSDSESLSKLVSNFPILEDLSLDCHLPLESMNLTIAAPVLKTLRIYFHGSSRCISKCSINCPKLENLDVTQDYWSTNYDWPITKSLVQANISHLQHYSYQGSSRASNILARFSNVTYLCLSSHCFQVNAVPVFENLRLLKLVVFDCFCWELLQTLLKRSIVLESLVLERKESDCFEEDSEHDESSEEDDDEEEEVEAEHEGLEHEEGSENEQDSANEEEGSASEEGSENEQEGSVREEEEGSENHQWNPPDHVPLCLSSHLKNVTLTGFTGQQDEMNVAKYLLKSSEVLDKMIICMGDLDLKQKAELYKELSMVPRASRTCIVQFLQGVINGSKAFKDFFFF